MSCCMHFLSTFLQITIRKPVRVTFGSTQMIKQDQHHCTFTPTDSKPVVYPAQQEKATRWVSTSALTCAENLPCKKNNLISKTSNKRPPYVSLTVQVSLQLVGIQARYLLLSFFPVSNAVITAEITDRRFRPQSQSFTKSFHTFLQTTPPSNTPSFKQASKDF